MLATAWGMRQIDADTNRVYVQNVKARDFQPCAPFVLEGRPYLDEVGNFHMLQPPGTAEDMNQYMPHKGGASVTQGKSLKIEQAVAMKAKGKSLRDIATVLSVSKTSVERWTKDAEKSVP